MGQGLANAVGMAFAEKLLADEFNRPDFSIVDHYTYAFCGDGCLMEGVSHEACSLAGTLGLGKLIVFYDDNGISIDGRVEGWFTDDTPKRFAAYGWHVVPAVDGHDAQAVSEAIKAARAETARPSLICCKTIIGFGAPHRQGTAEAHGEALGVDEVAAARVALGWPYPPFVVPDEIRSAWDHLLRARHRKPAGASSWHAMRAVFRKVRASSSAACAAICPPTGATPRRRPCRRRVSRTAPQATRAVLAGGVECHGSGAAGTAGRLGGPDDLEQHAVQGRRSLSPRRRKRGTTCTTACASSA